MPIWIEVLARELAMLAVVTAIGAFPASLLRDPVDRLARLALAPALGLCVATSVLTTIDWFAPARSTAFVVVALALVSLGLAVWRRFTRATSSPSLESDDRRRPPLSTWMGAAQLIVVLAAVSVPLLYTLQERQSLGPASYAVADAAGYVAETDGLAHVGIAAARSGQGAAGNATASYWSGYTTSFQQFDIAPLSANLNELLGLSSTDTQGSFLIAVLAIGALALFAATRYLSGHASIAAVLAAVLYGGAFSLYLYFDGSQGALSGIAVLPAFGVVGAEAYRRARPTNLALLALTLAGLGALYPLFVPPLAVAVLITLAALAGLAWRSGARPTRRAVAVFLGRCLAVVALAAVLNLVSFGREVRYFHAVLAGSLFSGGLPAYHWSATVIPGWLLQTRGFYDVSYYPASLAHGGWEVVVFVAALPALFIAVIGIGLWRYRGGLALVAYGLACAAAGAYAATRSHSTYGEARNLLPLAPAAMVLLSLGVSAIASGRQVWRKLAAVGAALLVLVPVVRVANDERIRFANGSYLQEASLRSVIAHLPPGANVLLEGFGEGARAVAENALVYALAEEQSWGHVSIDSVDDDNSSLQYLGGPGPLAPRFGSDDSYILTRLAGVRTDRRVVARSGGVALEARPSAPDVVAASGLAVPMLRLDPTGASWVEGPMRFLVLGAPGGAARVGLRFQVSVPVGVPVQPGIRASRHGQLLTVCATAVPDGAVGVVSLELRFTAAAEVVPSEPDALPLPAGGVELTAMAAGTRSCPFSLAARHGTGGHAR